MINRLDFVSEMVPRPHTILYYVQDIMHARLPQISPACPEISSVYNDQRQLYNLHDRFIKSFTESV